ncbi:MAG TPA: MBL fold metallo-hydrolase [Thermodesulfobacteriota bacterium]|nr:MBL fold metallo-hydrolase [Thermodesulfobacteriota bacterium]
MMRTVLMIVCLSMGGVVMGSAAAQDKLETDVIATSAGNLEVAFIGHGTMMMKFSGKVIHIDPWTQLADYAGQPKADLILVTHEHRDHLDVKAVEILRKENTVVIAPGIAAQQIKGARVLKNGETATVEWIKIESVPAYNLVHKRDTGVPFHPKGDGNGYVVTFGDKIVYIAGDTENTPEMRALKGIDIAFLPMNLPFTMTPEMVADAALAFRPKVLYPYHFGETDTAKMISLLKDSGIEVRIRKMK